MKSLTTSEFYALINDVAKNIGSNATGNDPVLYLEIVKYLRKQDYYDDKSLKAEFGYAGPGKSTAWRTLKRATINQILRAIERAPANENAKSLLQKAPTLIRILSGKEVWERTSSLTEKYIALARKQEEFPLLVQLLKLKQNIVLRQNEPETATLELSRIRQEREAAARAIQHEERINDLWLEVSVEIRKGAFADKERIREILDSPELEETRKVSRCAEMTYWNIRRAGCFALGDGKGFTEALDRSIVLAEGNLDDPGFFDEYINSLTRRIRYHLNALEPDPARELTAKLEALSKSRELSPGRLTRVGTRLHFIWLIMDLNTLSRPSIEENCKAFDIWFLKNRYAMEELYLQKISYRGAFNQFFVGEFAGAAKWIYRIREAAPSWASPQMTHFAWVFFLIARLEQGEHEMVRREIKATRKYLSEYMEHPGFYLRMVDFIADQVKEMPLPVRTGKRLKFADEVNQLLKLPVNRRFVDYFPYELWLRSESKEELRSRLLSGLFPFEFDQK